MVVNMVRGRIVFAGDLPYVSKAYLPEIDMTVKIVVSNSSGG
jgi:hypothetical protein